MYLGQGLLYLHVPRTAGTFVTNVLERQGGGSRNVEGIGVHSGVRRVPGRLLEDRLVVGTVRDPWSWYVSFYSYMKNRKTGNLTGPIADLVGNRASFSEALATMTRPRGQATILSPKLPGSENAVEPRIGKTLAESKIGLWSWYVLSTFCEEPVETTESLWSKLDPTRDMPWSVNVLVDAATVEIGLAKVLQAVGAPKAAETTEYLLRKATPVNECPPEASWKGVRPSGRPDPRWWDEASERAVLETDGPLMRSLGLDKPVGQRTEICVLSGG